MVREPPTPSQYQTPFLAWRQSTASFFCTPAMQQDWDRIFPRTPAPGGNQPLPNYWVTATVLRRWVGVFPKGAKDSALHSHPPKVLQAQESPHKGMKAKSRGPHSPWLETARTIPAPAQWSSGSQVTSTVGPNGEERAPRKREKRLRSRPRRPLGTVV